MKTKKFIGFPIKVTLGIAALFAAMLIAFSLIFYFTGRVMEAEAIKHIEYNASEISRSLDEIILNIYNVSDTFAIDDRLLEYTGGDYSKDPVKKRFATTRISNVLFASYDLLRNNVKMAAFYNNDTGEIFNFLDPNADDETCRKTLLSMDILAPENLARFVWHPVCDNFLRKDTTGDIRKDKAVIGSRKVFSPLRNTYIGVHVFALSEETLYGKYSEIATQYDSSIYIINESGSLLSSSNVRTLESGSADPELTELVLNRKYDRFDHDGNIIFVRKSNVNDWLTVISVPRASLTDAVNKLYRWILMVLILAAIAASVILLVFYKRFMRPIDSLSSAMRCVQSGDLNAYVDTEAANNELALMISCYNDMLQSINRSITERLNFEKHKRQLEMDVLMNQINPHFLYNTLETIVWRSTEAGHPDIGRIAAALGRMYRLSISGGKLFVSLYQELEHVSAYIKSQQSRYGDTFTFETKADYQQLRELYTIKMLLQPLTENSLSHALDGLKRVLHIRLSVTIFDSYVRVRLIDTGKGMTAEKLALVRRQLITGERPTEQPPRKSTGIGMHNVYERLKIYFGSNASISLWSKKNVGTVVELHLPLISKDEADRLNDEKDR